MLHDNLCITCGACCAHFRVSFYWTEAEPDLGGQVPLDLTEDVTEFIRCMKGTNCSHPYCTALAGHVGQAVYCRIYARRPSTCRDFGIHWSHGLMHCQAEELARCNRARRACHLPPISAALLSPTNQRKIYHRKYFHPHPSHHLHHGLHTVHH